VIERRELRAAMRSCRMALSRRQRAHQAELAAQAFARSWLFRQSRAVAGYLARQGEMDPAPLLKRALAMHKQVYLPVLHALDGYHLWFAPYRPGDPLRPNKFGIPEPVCPLRRMRRAQDLDLIMVPLLAFDRLGQRLGMGGGFYDRTLAFRLRRRFWKRPRIIGLAYSFQKVDVIPSRPWDVPLDGVVTERNAWLP
jgi:5-formyltetrahydrofolate cyclo-ligase